MELPADFPSLGRGSVRKKKKRREERRKGKEDHRYVNYGCMEIVTFRMEKYRFFFVQ